MHDRDESTVVIGCAADGNYALPLAVALASAQAGLCASRTLSIYVVDGGLSAQDRSRIRASLAPAHTLHWLRPQRTGFTSLPLWGRMSISTYDKLALLQLLPASESRVIWLDSDVLVLGDLARLWDAALDGAHVLAVRDALVRRLGAPFGVTGFRELGLDADAPYFNAGVMVIDLGRWRRDEIPRQALAYLQRFRRRVFFWDQEGLNAVLAGRWREIDAGWNWNLGVERLRAAGNGHRIEEGRAAAEVLHFCGKLKPWQYAGGQDHAIYYRYLDRTAWEGWRPQWTCRDAFLARYGASAVRRLLYPLEHWHVRLERQLTRRYIP